MSCKHRSRVLKAALDLEPIINALLAERNLSAAVVVYCPECACNQVTLHRDGARDSHAEDKRAFEALYEGLQVLLEELKEGEKHEQKTNENPREKLN